MLPLRPWTYFSRELALNDPFFFSCIILDVSVSFGAPVNSSSSANTMMRLAAFDLFANANTQIGPSTTMRIYVAWPSIIILLSIDAGPVTWITYSIPFVACNQPWFINRSISNRFCVHQSLVLVARYAHGYRTDAHTWLAAGNEQRTTWGPTKLHPPMRSWLD